MFLPLYIKWNAINETGIALLDEQHRGIVSIINTFYYMMQKHEDAPSLYTCISEALKNYSHIHFVTEEALLETVQYKEIEKHKKAHTALGIEVERIEKQIAKDNDTRPLLEFLKKWWLGHINEEDMLYVPYLSSQR